MPRFKRVCVFCGSSPGGHPEYREVARSVGQLLAQRGMGLVFGGGKVGLMGEVANGALEAGGEVVGVIPRHLEAREVAHLGLTQLHVVETMHQRKAMMADLSDAFVALPGGLGTLEELFEIATWSQLGIHQKPLGLLNVRGYYDLLNQFLGHAVEEKLLRPEHRAFISVASEPEALFTALENCRPMRVDKWVELPRL